jgi:hypothetical protein
MCMDNKEILRRVIQGFQLIPAKQGFGHPYVTKTGAATPDLSKRINTWIKQNFPQSNIMTSYEGVYKTINFRRVMAERKINLAKILAELGYNPLERQEKPRYIYVYTFPPEKNKAGEVVKYAYVGLTNNLSKRHRQHVNPVKKNIAGVQGSSPVFRYAQKVGVQPHKEILTTEPVTEKEAIDLERSTIEKYKEEGWTMLNLAKGGSLGGNIKDEKAIINGIDNFVNSTGTDLKTLNLIPGSDYTTNAIEYLGLAKEFFERLKEIVEANNITSTKQLRDKKEVDRRVSKLIEDWSRLHREDDNWQEKLFPGNLGSHGAKQKGIEGFLAEPNNLDKDQVRFLTKRSGVGITPKEEKALLKKLGKIIVKYNVKSPGELNTLDPTRKNAFDVMFSLQAGDAIKKGKEDWRDILWPEGYPGRGTGAKRKAAVAESLNSKEVFKHIIKNYISKP